MIVLTNYVAHLGRHVEAQAARWKEWTTIFPATAATTTAAATNSVSNVAGDLALGHTLAEYMEVADAV
jgi:hypothetical protein